MKKSFAANINGTIYNIDEDAYQLLDRYLKELHHTFTGETGDEIVADIESRVSEHFSAKGTRVIGIEDVESVISVIGRPEQLGEETGDTPDAAEGQEPEGPATPPPYPGTGVNADSSQPEKRLYRYPPEAVFGGVFAGLSYYLGWNVTAMRVLYVALALVSYFWPLTVIYLVAWMLIPAAKTPRQVLQMMGAPVNLATIGETLIDNVRQANLGEKIGRAAAGGGSAVQRGFQSVGRIIMAVFGGVAALTVFVMLILVMVLVAGIIIEGTGGDTSLLDSMSVYSIGTPILGAWAMVCIFLAISIPLAGLAYGGLMALFNAPTPSRATVITLIVAEAVIIVAAAVLAALAGSGSGNYAMAMPALTAIPTVMLG